ncbi:putative ATP-dependent RNA helicase SoYb [Drosophila rhopaloa]|uniref:RNA helicase n=1 Tax=Drosophila rhopaloa TaxID=1041015 RepID=A0A6P4F1M4_DRORH|nr:putative ATP-dependent RNA helicase SoYb [Drosophila rhopaloa]
MKNLEVPSFTVESRGTTFTYASPRSGAASMDFVADTIRAKDPSTSRIVLICQQNSEADHLKSELGIRNVNTIRLAADDPMVHQVLLLWSKGYIQQALILCDGMLNFLEGIEVNLGIHATLPPLKTFEERLEMLSKSETKAEMLVITGPNEENNSGGNINKPEPEIGDFPQNGVNQNPKMVGQPVKEMTAEKAQNIEDIYFKRGSPVKSSTDSQDCIKPVRVPELQKTEKGAIPKAIGSPTSPSITIENHKHAFEVFWKQFGLKQNSENSELSSVSFETIPTPLNLFELEDQEDTPSSDVEDILEEVLNRSLQGSTNSDSSTPILFGSVPTPQSSLEIEQLTEKLGQECTSQMPGDSSVEDPIDLYTSTSPESFQSFEEYDPGASPKDDPPPAAVFPHALETTRYHFGVLAWSRHVLIPCYSLSGVSNISTPIRRAMEQLGLGTERARGIQRFAWPHVSSGKSLMVVGNMQSGKTWCYLPTLCQRSHEILQRRPADGYAYGPASIFVCPNQLQGNQIERWVSQLLGSLEDDVYMERVVTLWEKGSVAYTACRLYQPVGILLTTVDLLLQLMTHHSKRNPIFDARAVKYIALDNLNDMVRLLPVTTTKLLKRLPELFDFGQGKCQLLVSGRTWHDDQVMDRVLSLMPDALVLFEDPLEASFYMGAKLEHKVLPETQKLGHLVGLIRGRNLAEERIAVVCPNQVEVLRLSHLLAEMDVKAQACFSEAGFSMVAKWRDESRALVLLVSDDVVPKLRCGRIDLLIHYSWASSWMRFKLRFALFYDNYKRFYSKVSGQSVVFVQETDVDNNWLLADFALKHLLPRPTVLLDILAHRRLADQPNSQMPKLCRQLIAYGDCLRYRCRYRHVMRREELLPPKHFPTKGMIQFTVVTCASPANLAVRLSDQFPTKSYFLGFAMTQLGEQVQRHYEVDAHRRQHPNPKPGDKAVVKNLKRYERVVIVDVEKNDKVVVRLLDSSLEILTYNASKVYICEEIFKLQTDEAMEIRILGMEPGNLERIWGEDERQVVRTQFFSRLQNRRGRHFTAYVQFAIHDTIFVDNVYDDEGNDLVRFITDRFIFYQENDCLSKFNKLTQATGPC